MAAEVLSFQQEEGKTAYYATFVSDGNPVTIQIKNKGGMVTVFANIEGMNPIPLSPKCQSSLRSFQCDISSYWHSGRYGNYNKKCYESVRSEND